MQRTHSDIKSWLWVVTLVFVLASGPDAHSQEGPAPNEMQSGSLLLRMQTGYATATLLNTSVDMNISGLVARVSGLLRDAEALSRVLCASCLSVQNFAYARLSSTIG